MVKWGVEGVMYKILGRGNKKEENNLGSEKTKGIEGGSATQGQILKELIFTIMHS